MNSHDAVAEPGRGAPGGGQGAADERRQDVVTITINNVEYPIHRGRQSVSAIKRVGNVPQADELAQVIEANTPPLTPLSDDGAVTIKGGEVFVSYPKDSGSSFCGPLAEATSPQPDGCA